MMRFRCVAFVCLALTCASAQAGEWRVRPVNVPARVTDIETVGGQVRVLAGGLWYAVKRAGDTFTLAFIDDPALPKLPDGALPDGHMAAGTHEIARAWLAEPTDRYDHGALGDKIEAAALVIEMRDGTRQTVRLKGDAVFEDLKPRIADVTGEGHDEIVLVKSYLKRGSALAVIGARKGKYEIVAETPPLGAPHRWLDPAGIADFTGDHKIGIALVREPHLVGSLELWGWRDNKLQKLAELPDAANHIAGTRAIDMAVVGDFDGDNTPDIAIPSLDRTQLRIVSFAPRAREIARIALPAKAATNLGLIDGVTAPAVALGLADGSLILVVRDD